MSMMPATGSGRIIVESNRKEHSMRIFVCAVAVAAMLFAAAPAMSAEIVTIQPEAASG